MLGLTCALLAATTGALGAPELPPGFELTTFFHAFTGPTSLAWSPDGALWVSQAGPGEGMHLWVWRDGEVTRVHSFPWIPSGERSIHAVAVDPDYLQNGRLWVYHTAYDPFVHNRLSHFTNSAITDPSKHAGEDHLQDEVIVMEGPAVLDQIHNGGCLAFASDKTLFLGMGDDNQGSATAQNPLDLRGKILHLDRDGAGAAGNPFPDGVAGDPRVWALGFRNPFRCSVQPLADNLFIGDVGGATWEEIDIGVPGGNFGWAVVEGSAPAGVPGFVYPIHAYNHDGAGAAVIGGDHAEPGDFAPEYTGDYFFGDWARNEIYRMVLDPGNSPLSVERFASGIGRVTDLEFGPDGALYLSVPNTSGVTIRRIAFVGGTNGQPSAVGVARPASGPAPLSVTLDAMESSDPDDDPLTYDWTLGDGNAAGGPIVRKVYPQGVYEAGLSVSDDGGLTGVAPPIRIVSGNVAPTATLVAPAAGTTYEAGQTIAYSGQGDDPQDGSLDCSRFSWQIAFHHGNHTHPFFGPEQGSCGGTFTVPNRGETSPDVRYRLHLVVEDLGTPIGAEGVLAGGTFLDILPKTSTMTFRSAPLPDLQLTLDTVPFTPPLSVEGVTGLLRDVGAVDPQLGSNGLWYRWVSWSDGGAAHHTLTTPAVATRYTADFACVPHELTDLHIAADGGELVLTWEWTSPECFAAGPERYRIYAASTARPSGGSGGFPADPAFRLVGTSPNRSFRYAPEPGDVYFVVVGVNPQGQRGLTGHYGF